MVLTEARDLFLNDPTALIKLLRTIGTISDTFLILFPIGSKRIPRRSLWRKSKSWI